MQIALANKLAGQGTTIFSQMTALAQRLQALNLAQGFPDFAPPAALLQHLIAAIQDGQHQYPPRDGILALREQLAVQFLQRDQIQLDPEQELCITAGATIAIYCAIQSCVQAGDEVIVFDPSYDSYAPSIELAGGKAVHIALQPPTFAVDWDQVKAAINNNTRMIIVNTPHNPTGTVWGEEDWQQLIALIAAYNIVVLSDEVYEHIVFDGRKHLSALQFPALRARSFVVGSFGKSFHVTGWKTGYCVAAPALLQQFCKVYQFAQFCAVHPMQIALAQFMQQYPEHLAALSAFYQHKRDLFLTALQDSVFIATPSQGSYFQNLDYRQFKPELDAMQMCQYLATEHKLVAIPVSAFYQTPPPSLTLIRLCFAKQDETLVRAGEILSHCR
ncbi:methionine aminotransferase [Acinetobacter larvae]|uniref:Aminotransferase n=1 Tax=Acinetobacter larvae TaxID=1789224 RepID=A0A1B2M3D5_9GAMM|nr:methionine aminotransferase [Acinetobacter larvae]AOA59707.1 aminotransferase [Acinetobacter larvae]